MASQYSVEELTVNGRIAQKNRKRVQAEITAVLKFDPNLHAGIESYMDNMGNESMLITLRGTIPMFFLGVRYNTPVNIFIPAEYPSKPPIVFVRPNANMTLKADHPNVNRNGECMHKYFQNWDPNHSNLTDAVKMLSDDFSKIPPLLTKSSAAHPPPPPQPQPAQQSQHAAHYSYSNYGMMSPSMAPTSIGGGGNNSNLYRYPAPQQPQLPSQPQQQQPIPPPPEPKELTPRELLSAKVRGRIARDSAPAVDLQKKLYEAEVELTRELACLRDMENDLPRLSAEMDEVKTACDNESAEIEEELKEFETLKQTGGPAALADAVVAVNNLSDQALTEMAKRDALEDVMYELMRGMNPHNHESVLKLIRNAASDQFISVALLAKIEKASTGGGHARAASTVGGPH